MSVILCTAGYDHTIRFWEALSGICSRTIQHPESQVNRLCITPDKKYLAAAGRHAVRLYDIKSSNPNPVMTFEGHTNNITGVAFHCEGKWMVTSSEDQTVRVWDTRSGAVQRNYPHGHAVNDVVIHPNQGELISADRGGNIRIWDLSESMCTHQLIPEEDVPVASVSVASDGSLLAAGNNKGHVYIWRMYQTQESTTLLPCRQFRAHRDTYITRLLLSPDIRLLATCSADHTVRIWNIDMNEEYLEHVDATDTTADTPTTGTNPDHPNTSLDMQTTNLGSASQLTTPISPAAPHLFQTNFARSARRQQASAQASASQSQSQSQAQSPAVENPTSTSTSTSNSNSNSMSSSQVSLPAYSQLSQLIDAWRPLPLETTLENHQRWVWDCAFSADSAYLVTVCSDHYARLWELASSTIIRQYSGHHRGAVCVALNDYSSPP